MKVRLAAVQPRSGGGSTESRNAVEVLDWLDRAAAAGADLVLFPAGYPGPVSPDRHSIPGLMRWRRPELYGALSKE